jgi:Fe-S oxidoreductase
MKRSWQTLNVSAMVILFIFLGAVIANGFASRQPWALVCYKCKACDNSCILGIDPQGFVDAALAGNPNIYIYTTNVRLPLSSALAMDPAMMVTVGERHVTARSAAEELQLPLQTEVLTYRVQARHAAQLCLRCGACERQCVLGLPLMRIINQLRQPSAISQPEVSHAK